MTFSNTRTDHKTYFSLSVDAVPFSGNIMEMASKITSLGKLLCVEDAELVLAAVNI